MWGRRRRGPGPRGAEELRARRREREAALRKARRQEQLVSKRLLREDTTAEEGGQDGAEVTPDPLSEDEVLELLRGVQKGSEDRKRSLSRLRWALQNKETQQKFVRLDGSIRTLIGLFTSSLADMQMEAARCLHELSHSSDPAVAEACLPVTSYLLTYLSGHSVEFTELCLYTLGNLVVESEAMRKQLLPQGIIPVLASCIQTLAGTELPALFPAVTTSRDPSAEGCSLAAESHIRNCGLPINTLYHGELQASPFRTAWVQQAYEANASPHEAVLEGLGYVLSQLLQAKEAPTEIIPLVLDSVLPQHMIRLVCSSLKAGIGAAVEFAWCLHYIVCSHTANAALLSLGALPALTSLLLDLASAIPQDAPEGLELLVCPVLRCLSNLLAEETGCEVQIQDERLLIALFLILQHFLQQHPFIVQECLWLLNNLTADKPFFCSALLSLDLLPALMRLLPCSQMASVLVLTVLCNIAVKGPAYCQQLHQQPALPLLLPALALPDPEVVGQCLELLHLLFRHCPEAAADFVRQGGRWALEQHQSTPELQERAQALLAMVRQSLGASTFSPCDATLSAFS